MRKRIMSALLPHIAHDSQHGIDAVGLGCDGCHIGRVDGPVEEAAGLGMRFQQRHYLLPQFVVARSGLLQVGLPLFGRYFHDAGKDRIGKRVPVGHDGTSRVRCNSETSTMRQKAESCTEKFWKLLEKILH